MNKICTSLEQSKKLIELGIDVYTADMYWWYSGRRYYVESMDDDDFNKESDIPAWSLTALLIVLPQGTRLLKSATDEMYHCDCPKGNVDKWFDNPLDAAFEMVVLLLKNGKI